MGAEVTIDWTVSLGNIIVFLGSVVVSIVGYLITSTLKSVNNELRSHDKRIATLEVAEAAARAYDRGYADARRTTDQAQRPA